MRDEDRGREEEGTEVEGNEGQSYENATLLERPYGTDGNGPRQPDRTVNLDPWSE